MIGASAPMQKIRDTIDKVAPTDARILVTGENGVGKELVARWIHEKSNRANGPIVEVNCAAIPTELIESDSDTLPTDYKGTNYRKRNFRNIQRRRSSGKPSKS